jgi:glycosyltransferase involved in cell wall biosynthesis
MKMEQYKVRISVVINTLNEEKNLPYALRSVRPWADEIIVVDMHSEDRTVEIAQEFGAKVFLHERVGYADPARAYAVSNATAEWILMLDADEVVPAPLSRHLKRIADDDRADIVMIPWLNYLLGAPLKYSGWGPEQDKHFRFFKRGMMEITSKIHGYYKFVPGGRVLQLAYQPGMAVVHFNYVDAWQFLEKLNRYTTIEAQQASERGERASAWRALYWATREFLNRYLLKQGYRDGWRGFYLSGLMAMYRWVAYAKLQELKSTGGRKAALDSYRHEAERIIAGYGVEAP